MVQSCKCFFFRCITRRCPFYNSTFRNRILSDMNIIITNGKLIDRALKFIKRQLQVHRYSFKKQNELLEFV